MRRYGLHLLLLLLLVGLGISAALAQEPPPPTLTPAPGSTLEQTARDAVDITEDIAQATARTLQDFLDQITITPESDALRLLLIVAGALLLVAGWRISQFIIIITGMAVGAILAVTLVGEAEGIMPLVALIIGGLLGAGLAALLYTVAVFFIGAYIGLVLVNAAASVLGVDQVSAVALLIGAAIGGVLLLGLSFQLLVLLSAVVGAQMLTQGLDLASEWTLLLAIGGILIQLIAIRTFHIDIRRRPRGIRLFGR